MQRDRSIAEPGTTESAMTDPREPERRFLPSNATRCAAALDPPASPC